MRTYILLFATVALAVSVGQAQSYPSSSSGGSSAGQSSSDTGRSDANCQQDPYSATCVPQGSSSSGSYGSGQNGTGMQNSYDPRLPSNLDAGAINGSANQQFTAPSYRDESALPNQAPNGRNRIDVQQPEPLTEFQKFVAETTGQVLPIFGARLFQQVPTTFAPVDQIPVPEDALVGPGDLLRIRIWGQVNFNADLRVDRSGEIYLPQVGPIHVAELRYADLDKQLRTAIGRVYRNFNVAVELGQIRAIQVYVVGRARRPGTYTVSSLSTMVDTIFASGGPSLAGSMRHIQLKRAGVLIADLDLYDLLIRGDKSSDRKLESGDVLYIPAAGPQIAVTGSVKTPAIYEERGPGTVGKVLEDAAGVTSVAGGAKLLLERMEEREGRSARQLDFNEQGLATPVLDGDIVEVQPRVPQYAHTVTLRGNTANPGRYSWHAGMRLSELLPEREALLTRNYWWERTSVGLPAPEFTRSLSLDSMTQVARPQALPTQQEQFDRARAEQRARAEYLLANPGAQQAYDAIAGVGASAAEVAAGTNPGDPRTLNSGNRVPASGSGETAPSSDAAARRGVTTQNTAGAREITRVSVPAPEIDWKYAVVERLDKETLKTSLLPFDLGRLVLDHDASQDLELQSGDVVTIFSQADIHVPQEQQTHYVRLEGEFLHAGVYSTRPGENLRDLVQRAGGFAPGAYLFGSEFTRASVQAVQQHRLDDYVEKLQLQIERGILATASAASSSPASLASASVAGSEARELVTRLQQIRATGRIVLNMYAYSNSVENLPSLSLEDGDTFYVPAVPSNVSVIGAVYDQNSFLYKPGNHVYDYLHLAGGGNKDADRAHPYVIRADGSVLSQSQIGDKKFKQIVIQPGDTIVVSEKTFGPTRLRDFLNFSQLFSQLAISGALLSNL